MRWARRKSGKVPGAATASWLMPRLSYSGTSELHHESKASKLPLRTSTAPSSRRGLTLLLATWSSYSPCNRARAGAQDRNRLMKS